MTLVRREVTLPPFSVFLPGLFTVLAARQVIRSRLCGPCDRCVVTTTYGCDVRKLPPESRPREPVPHLRPPQTARRCPRGARDRAPGGVGRELGARRAGTRIRCGIKSAPPHAATRCQDNTATIPTTDTAACSAAPNRRPESWSTCLRSRGIRAALGPGRIELGPGCRLPAPASGWPHRLSARAAGPLSSSMFGVHQPHERPIRLLARTVSRSALQGETLVWMPLAASGRSSALRWDELRGRGPGAAHRNR
jgi:hypothetical protein